MPIGYDDGLKDLSELIKVRAQRLVRRLPGEPADEDLRVRRVAEGGVQDMETGARARRRTGRRPRPWMVEGHRTLSRVNPNETLILRNLQETGLNWEEKGSGRRNQRRKEITLGRTT